MAAALCGAFALGLAWSGVATAMPVDGSVGLIPNFVAPGVDHHLSVHRRISPVIPCLENWIVKVVEFLSPSLSCHTAVNYHTIEVMSVRNRVVTVIRTLPRELFANCQSDFPQINKARQKRSIRKDGNLGVVIPNLNIGDDCRTIADVGDREIRAGGVVIADVIQGKIDEWSIGSGQSSLRYISLPFGLDERAVRKISCCSSSNEGQAVENKSPFPEHTFLAVVCALFGVPSFIRGLKLDRKGIAFGFAGLLLCCLSAALFAAVVVDLSQDCDECSSY